MAAKVSPIPEGFHRLDDHDGRGVAGAGRAHARVDLSPDVDAVHESAIVAGGTSLMAPADPFSGDRGGGVKDVWGNMWWIGTHIEDGSSDEIQRRAEAAANKCT